MMAASKPASTIGTSAVPHGWFDRATMAAVFDVSLQHFDRHQRRLAPAAAQRTIAGRPMFHARSLLDAWLSREVEKVRAAASDDPLLIGDAANSPALERYRTGRAEMIEMDVQLRRGTLVTRRSLEHLLYTLTTTIRTAVEALQKRFGNEAGEIMDEAVNEWSARMERYLCQRAEGGEAAEASDK